MSAIEKINFEINHNPEKSLEKKEVNNIPEQKYENICKKIWENSEFVNEICKNMDIFILSWLEDKWIDWKKLYEQNNIKIA